MNALVPAGSQWSDRLAMDVALMLEGSSETLEEVLERHAATMADLECWSTDKIFLQKVQLLREEVHEKGLTFRVKARAQAEALLTTSWELIHANDVSANVKADLIKSTVKWAGLEPKEAQIVEGGGAGGVSITINLDPTGPAKPAVSRVIEGEVVG